MQAVIMAGGFGTRLRPLSCNIPKPMVPMVNRPMLFHIIELLKKHGFTDLTMMLYFQPDVITEYFGDGSKFGVKIRYLRPEGDLGTAGSVKFAQKHINGTFLVISGDVLTDFDLTKAVEYHKHKKAAATMILTRVPNPLQFGVVIAGADGKIERFLEKPSWGEVFSDTINTGIYVLEPKVFDNVPAEKSVDFSKDLFPALLKEDKGLFGYTAEGYWKDVGNLDEYRLGHYDVLENKLKISIAGRAVKVGGKEIMVGENTKIEDGVEVGDNVVIGNDCHIHKGAFIGHSVLGDNVTIGAGANIYGSVLWNNTCIGREARLKEAVISENTTIGDKAVVQVGTVVADGCTIGAEAVIRAYIKSGPIRPWKKGRRSQPPLSGVKSGIRNYSRPTASPVLPILRSHQNSRRKSARHTAPTSVKAPISLPPAIRTPPAA